MKIKLYASVAAVALGTAAQAEELTVFGTWLGEEQTTVEMVLADFAKSVAVGWVPKMITSSPSWHSI